MSIGGFRGRARRVARAGLERAADGAGFDLVKRHFDSPLPELETLPSDLWKHPSTLLGVDLRLEHARRFLEHDLSPFLAEFRPPLQTTDEGGEFYIRNGTYESVDAESLYAILRYAQPARVIELGSGSSSHVIEAARQVNAGKGTSFEHKIFDPFPWQATGLGPVRGAVVHEISATRVDLKEFDALASGDVLFVDTAHSVKTGGAVTHIILDVLPRLASGVLVHFHDVFLPYEYPRHWVVEERRAYAEQYLLHAFLAFTRISRFCSQLTRCHVVPPTRCAG